MTSQASIRPYLNQAYLLGLMMMAVGLTLSPFLMGMANFWLVIVWVVEGFYSKSFNNKLSRFWHNKAAVLLAAFYVMHVVGLLWTTDFQYAMKDLRVKLPILVLPFVLSSMEPLDRKRFDLLMQVYVLSVFVATLFSFSAYLKHEYEDIREISRFISHIRFCLNIVLCIAIILYYVGLRGFTPADRVGRRRFVDELLRGFMLVWFFCQINVFESLSGYVVLAAVVILSLLFAFFHMKISWVWRFVVLGVAMAAFVIGVVFVAKEVRPLVETEKVDFATLEKKTALGNDYWHDTIHNPVEDGKYVGLYYCRKELQEAWPQRSSLPLDGLASNGEDLEATLARYLTSKDLRKDAEGVMALTDIDIRNIEQGVPNYNNWRHPGLRARLSSTLFEYELYRRNNDPNGGSFSQRIEFTRASFHIIGRHPWFGVGTGDVPQAFSEAYDEIHSPLKEDFRFRAHNQYLAIAVAFGLVGLAFFLVVLFYPWFALRKRRSALLTFLYTLFLVIMLLSMLAEDTLETQAGASLFAFFEALLLCGIEWKE